MFKDRLRQLRRQAGLTQKKLGELIGAGESTISEWESGKRSPDIGKLPEIAAALKVDPRLLLDAPPPELSNVYFRFAKDAEKNGIDPRDIETALEMIKKLREPNGSAN